MCLTEAGTRLTAAPRVHAGGCVADTARPVPVPPLPITAPHGSPYEVGLRESPYVRKIAYTVRQSGARPCCAVHSLHCGLLPRAARYVGASPAALGKDLFLTGSGSGGGGESAIAGRGETRRRRPRAWPSRPPARRDQPFADPAHNRVRVDASPPPPLPPATSTGDTPVTDRFGAPGGGRKVTFGPGGLAVRSPRTSLSSICSPMSAAKPAATSAIRATGGKA